VKNKNRLLIAVGVGGLLVVAVWLFSGGLKQTTSSVNKNSSATQELQTSSLEGDRIQATLYLGDSNGKALVPVPWDVPKLEDITEQGRQIVLAQLSLNQPPLVSVIPSDTNLRAFFISDNHDAFIDLTSQATTNHPGGSTTELLTVYALVNAVTTNLATTQRVQILINGREVDTLAGHVDLRRPLEHNVSIIHTKDTMKK
tara:strand:- start:202 stop:801 length:600 start_codon:yes stop_codon:yes gene_type:complete